MRNKGREKKGDANEKNNKKDRHRKEERRGENKTLKIRVRKNTTNQFNEK